MPTKRDELLSDEILWDEQQYFYSSNVKINAKIIAVPTADT